MPSPPDPQTATGARPRHPLADTADRDGQAEGAARGSGGQDERAGGMNIKGGSGYAEPELVGSEIGQASREQPQGQPFRDPTGHSNIFGSVKLCGFKTWDSKVVG